MGAGGTGARDYARRRTRNVLESIKQRTALSRLMAVPAPLSFLDPLEAAPDPVAHIAPDGRILRANRAFGVVCPNGAPPALTRAEDGFFSEGMRRYDALGANGRLYEWVERRLLDGSRVALARDVTERAAAAAQADRAKTVLFATLTHELRTPLHGVLGLAKLIGQSALEPDARAHVAALRDSGEHLLDLINDILDYSRIEAGDIALDAAPFDPEASAQAVAEVLSPKARAKGLELAVVADARAPARVRGDEGRFRQILFNLAGNAVKFTERGGVILEVARGAHERLRLVVRDTGPGVPAAQQSMIFGEFQQADASIARLYGGAGLGLAIVRKLAHAMGGEVGLDSAAGEGAAFWVELPLDFLPPLSPGPRLEGARVAYATTSPIMARTLEATLINAGARAAAIDHLPTDEHSDVILIDHERTIDARAIAACTARTGASIVLIAQEEREAIGPYRQLGVAHYLIKPLRRASLIERIRVAMGKGPARATRAARDDREETALLTGARILLAEDNPINALLARTILARAGGVIDVVGDGEEAVAAAAASAYDLILLDLRMPRMDGLAAARAIRAGFGLSRAAPIVAVTADVAEEDRRAALEAGMDDFLTKPFDLMQLASVAARFTSGAKTGSVSPS